MEQTHSCREGGWWKEREGSSQRTSMNDPQMWTTEKELTAGERVGLGEGGQEEKKEIGTTVLE